MNFLNILSFYCLLFVLFVRLDAAPKRKESVKKKVKISPIGK